jgi:hypothetical protein
MKRLWISTPDEATAIRFWRGCIGKIRYPSKKHAVSTARSIGDPLIGAYKCPSCGRWHLGHSKRRVTIVVVEED